MVNCYDLNEVLRDSSLQSALQTAPDLAQLATAALGIGSDGLLNEITALADEGADETYVGDNEGYSLDDIQNDMFSALADAAKAEADANTPP
uniref:Uncharacterized protein n=1 Tax=viral metagenome TaxID=1070528 RepID=A0A6M3LBU8_9ZZZZ